MAIEEAPSYSVPFAFIYLFNVIVGIGALALPHALAKTGWLLGVITLAISGCISYITATYVIETLSITNAAQREKMKEKGNYIDADSKCEVIELSKSNKHVQSEERRPLLCSNDHTKAESPYEITVKYEFSDMTKLYFPKYGVIIYYIVFCLNLCGTMSVYVAAISKSLTTAACGGGAVFKDVNLPCHNMGGLKVIHIYRIMLAIFVAIVCPFVFTNITKTRYLQMVTTLYRWSAFILMVVLACIMIGKHKRSHHPKKFDSYQLPSFFGVCVYGFMAHDAIPSLLTPTRNKKRLHLLVLLDFLLIFVFYCLLGLTAVFAFGVAELDDVYALNFYSSPFLQYFLGLFPVLTLSTTFPLLGITLRDNLKGLCLTCDERECNFFVRKLLFPLIVITPPIIIACCTYNIELLVNVMGTYLCAIIQYVLPTLLVYRARKFITKIMGVYENKYCSPFRHGLWYFVVIGWYLMTFLFVTYNFTKKIFVH